MSVKKNKPFLQIHIVDHCNLNCKGCAHFAPIAKKKSLGVDELVCSYEKISPYLEEWFCRIELMGGEPLLHDDINNILEVTRDFFKSIEIRLVTNGIKLLEMQDDFFESCVRNNIVICISIYPIEIDLEAIERKLNSYGIKHKRYGDFQTCKTFIKYTLNIQGEAEPKESYKYCKYSGHCIQLKEGKIYPCFISAYAQHLNDYFGTAFEWTDRDYLHLEKKIKRKEFERLIFEPVPFCRFCNMRKMTHFKWDVSKRNIKEWIE